MIVRRNGRTPAPLTCSTPSGCAPVFITDTPAPARPAARAAPPRPRPRRGPHPYRQRHRLRPVPVPPVRHQRRLARTRPGRHRPARLDPTLLLDGEHALAEPRSCATGSSTSAARIVDRRDTCTSPDWPWARTSLEYTIAATDDVYRLITTIVDPTRAPAEELAGLYAQRWEFESTLDEIKTHLGGLPPGAAFAASRRRRARALRLPARPPCDSTTDAPRRPRKRPVSPDPKPAPPHPLPARGASPGHRPGGIFPPSRSALRHPARAWRSVCPFARQTLAQHRIHEGVAGRPRPRANLCAADSPAPSKPPWLNCSIVCSRHDGGAGPRSGSAPHLRQVHRRPRRSRPPPHRGNPRVIKRKMANWPLKERRPAYEDPRHPLEPTVTIVAATKPARATRAKEP